ncbi:MAG: hypothetical protein AAFX50_06515, partial [Acidobacteriota bacterium]
MRVDVVIHRTHRATALARWAWRLARAFEARLNIVWGLEIGGETKTFPSEEAESKAEAQETMVGAPAGAMKLYVDLMEQAGARHPITSTLPESAPPLPLPEVTIICPAGSEPLDALLQYIKRDPPDILVVAPPETRGRQSVARV